MTPAPKYKRLGPVVGSLSSYGSVWSREDHLLLVDSSGVSEKYQRVWLRDVRGIFIVPTRRRAWWAAAWAVPLGLGALMLAGGAPPPLGWSVVAFGAIGELLNFVLGPGCRVYAYTGVQNAVLASMVRRRRAEALLADLVPRIVQAQGAASAPPPAVPAPPGVT